MEDQEEGREEGGRRDGRDGGSGGEEGERCVTGESVFVRIGFHIDPTDALAINKN